MLNAEVRDFTRHTAYNKHLKEKPTVPEYPKMIVHVYICACHAHMHALHMHMQIQNICMCTCVLHVFDELCECVRGCGVCGCSAGCVFRSSSTLCYTGSACGRAVGLFSFCIRKQQNIKKHLFMRSQKKIGRDLRGRSTGNETVGNTGTTAMVGGRGGTREISSRGGVWRAAPSGPVEVVERGGHLLDAER